MIEKIADWCSRNIELIIWFNIALLFVSAAEQLINSMYPMGLCVILVAVALILRK